MIRCFFAVLLLAVSSTAFGQVVINEIQSSNGFTISDEDGDNSDWIELYNTDEAPVNLDGYWLSDNYDNPQRWQLPGVVLDPQQTLLIWASGKDRRNPEAALHTNFSIGASGEEILLSNAAGQLIDEVAPIAIPTDTSWGRQTDGADIWVFFTTPTPGASNTGEGFDELLAPPEFSMPGGYYPQAFTLQLSHPDPDVTIVYSLDGSIPELDAVDGKTYTYKNQYPQLRNQPFGDFLEGRFESRIYADGLPVGDFSDTANNISMIATSFDQNPYYFPQAPTPKIAVVRARAFKPGGAPSAVVSHSYLFPSSEHDEFVLPVISLLAQEDHLFDYHQGIYVAGERFDTWRQQTSNLPRPPNAADGASDANWHGRGDEWERPAHLELFEPGESRAALAQDIGIRIHGGWSRAHRQKSLRLYARNAYSESRFDYPIFGGEGDTGFRRLILRNSGNDNDYTLFRDAMIQRISAGLRFDTMDYRPINLFINGEYWGIHNVRERYDRHYLARHYGVDADNLDFLSGNADVSEGDAIHYQAMIEYIQQNDLADDQHFAHVQTLMDTDNFMDYTIANIFANNTDWPGNNIDFWRLRTEQLEADAPQGHDGRWRWLMFDTDFGFGLYGGEEAAQNNTLAFATEAGNPFWPNPDWSTLILRNLLRNEDYKNAYINRFADLLNSHFRSDRMIDIIEEMASTIEPDMPFQQQRWDHPWDWSQFYLQWDIFSWRLLVDVAKAYAAARPDFQRAHIVEHFALPGTYQLTINNPASQGHIRVNSLELGAQTSGTFPWQGDYFVGVPLEIEAIPAPGYRFSHWSGVADGSNPRITITPQANQLLSANFELDTETPLPYLFAWVFDSSLPNDTALETISASASYSADSAQLLFQSALSGYPDTGRRASMERRNAPTEINYPLDIPFADSNMRGLQIKQPFVGDAGENTLILEVPTSGFAQPLLKFAAIDEGAAQGLVVDYATNRGTPQWTSEGLAQTAWPLSNSFQLYSVDFSGIAAANNNPDFRVRIRFTGADMSADNGDRVTFNNITLEAQRISQPGEPAAENRRFENATTLTGGQGIVTANTTGASRQAGEPDHGAGLAAGGGDLETNTSLWWTWKATTTERIVFAADNNSVLQVYTGSALTTLQSVPQQRDGVGEVMFVALAGETYRIALASPSGAEGQVALTWDQAPPASATQEYVNAADNLAVICEIATCEAADDHRVELTTETFTLQITMASADQPAHSQQLQHLDANSAVVWQAQFSGRGENTLSRVIADVDGLPLLITELQRANPLDSEGDAYQYQIEAHANGLTRYRIVSGAADSDQRELLHLHMAVPGATAQLNEEGEMSLAVPVPGRDLRIWLIVDEQARVTAQYQRLAGDAWTPLGDLLVNTQFAEGSRLHVTRDQGVTRMHIETLVEQNLSF